MFKTIALYLANIRELQLLRSSGLFDRDWYLANNPDVVESKVNPWLHFLHYGGIERRDPGPDFNSGWYLDTYEDVKKAGLNPLIHYLRYGEHEGRKKQPEGPQNPTHLGNVEPEPVAYFDDNAERYFCVSMQRTGTTSVGRFFRDYGFQWAGWPHSEKNRWYRLAYDAAFETIFSSPDFRKSNAFEDSPWFFPDFYKFLYHRFPNSKFILFTRDPDAWFQSMLKHSRGNILGETRVHCKVYRRELEYFNLLHSGVLDEAIENQLFSEKTMKITGLDEHYKNIYIRHSIEVQDFFGRHAPAALHVGRLEDPQKWQKLGAFLGLNVPMEYESHENESKRKSLK